MKLYLTLIGILFFINYNQLNAQHELEEDLVAYYPFDGDARDLSINCLHGEVIGCSNAQGITSKYLTALEFDGIDDFVIVPDDDLLDFEYDQDFALSFWVKFPKQQIDQDTFDNDIISKWVINNKSDEYLDSGYPFSVRVFNNKKARVPNRLHFIQFGGYNKDCKGASTVLDRKGKYGDGFNHIVINVERGRIYLHVNNKLVARKGNDVFCSTVNEAPLLIGKRGGINYQNFFKGTIDNLAIYGRSLREEEIKILSDVYFDLGSILKRSAKPRTEITSDTLYFDEDKFELAKSQKKTLKSIHAYLVKSPDYHLEIRGHTNGLPDDDFCDDLSLKRAKVVENYLVSQGIRCNQVISKPMGKREQIAPNNTAEQRKLNQRVDFKLYYSGKS